MLRLFRKRHMAHVSASQLEIRRHAGRFGSGSVPSVFVDVAADGDVIEELQRWLVERDLSNSNLDIVLASNFVRFAVVPWDDGVENKQELEALARLQIAAAFGPELADSPMQIDLGVFRKDGIVCVIPEAIFNRLMTLCYDYGIRLRSLRPAFMVRFNQQRSKITQSSFLYACVEHEFCTLAFHDAAGWRSIRTVRVESGELLKGLLERELLLLGAEDDVMSYLDFSGTAHPEIVAQSHRFTLLNSPATGVKHA